MEKVGRVDGRTTTNGTNGLQLPAGTERIHAKKKERVALILYGSETGNAQDVAEEVGRMAERLRFDTNILDMDSVQLKDMLKPMVVIFVLSTTGQGEMPQNARSFWKTLLSGALKIGALHKVQFTTFGLGDSSYARYNVAHRMLHGRLVQLGAQPFCDRGEGNEQHPEGHSAGVREWVVLLKQKLIDLFPLAPDTTPIADDVFLEPKWQLAVANEAIDHTNGIYDVASNSVTNGNAHAEPARDLLPVKSAYVAEIVSNDRITSAEHFQDVRVMDLHLQDRFTYGPGAVAVVYPKNFPNDVTDFVQLMGWEDIADTALDLMPTDRAASGKFSPSPLDNFDLVKTRLTIRWLLENVLDIVSVPRRSFFASLAYFAGESNEDEAYQKERLLELANPELIDELWDYTTRPKRTILEVMMDFTTIKIPWQYVLTILPIMKGRQFSIASGGRLRTTEDGQTRVQLLVAIADPPSPIIKYRRRYGVCTRYIASLHPGQRINIGMQEGYLDVQPSEVEVPAVMIGPGTGLAPMRAMIWQRLQWAESLALKPSGERLAGDVLIFGCRNKSGDYFFRNEWDHLQPAQGLALLKAFSRDRNTPKEYVQDRIRAEAHLIREAVVDRDGKVYVCGSSGHMPKGVREALLDAIQDHVNIGTRDAAEAYLNSMEKAGRYKQETW